MAAYAALVSLRKTIQQINSDQVSFLLLEATNSLLAILEKYPDELNNFEDQIRDEANRAEDIIQHFMSKQFLSNDNPRSTTNVAFAYNQMDILRLLEELQNVAKEIHSIADEVAKLGDSPSTNSESSRLAPTSKDTVGVVEFEEDSKAINNIFSGDSFKLEVIPIYGMGGIGKSTLARKAYDYHSNTQHFDIIAWVTVSQNYNAQEFFSSLIVSSKSFEKEIRGHSIEEMRLRVFQTLKGRRYLVVIDDMWSTNVWDDVKTYFPDDNNKSRIIVTTRLFDVADYVDPFGRHHQKMRLMEEDQSWDLLRKKVFTDRSCPPELVSIGKVIAKSCRGLPLAIVVTAGLLSIVEQHPGSWQDTAKKLNLPGTTIDEHIEEILSLSYTNLPHYLRPCFLYMGAFPEDYKIHVSKLIKLCLAEGFLEPSDNISMEEWAEACFEKLVKRSLVLVNKRKSNGKIKSYNLHDLVLKMCISKAEVEKFPCTNISSLASRSIIYFEDGGRLLGTLDSYKC